jgi:energy-coupling factor transport system ATP-binding protein
MIDLQNLSFLYGGSEKRVGIWDINLHVEAGSFVLLCGVSGCGKTTLTRVINGLIPHFYEGELTGRVIVQDRNIAETPLYETAGIIGSVFQNPRSQFFNLDTDSEVAFGCENMGLPESVIRERVQETVAGLHIENLMGRDIFALSAGEKQKIACASVGALNPSVIVLDEPSSNLDMKTIKDLRRLLNLWKSQGKTIIIAEHRLHYLAGMVDRILYMREGRIVHEYTWADMESLYVEERNNLGLRLLNLRDMNILADSSIENSSQVTGAPEVTKTSGIVLSNFCFSYNHKQGQQVLNIPSLDLPQNGIIAVIGHNGAGKSTFARCLCGLEKRCPGIISIEGKTYKAGDRLKHCYMVMQDVNHQLFTESVLDEVLISMKEPVTAEAERILKSLDLLSIKDLHPMSLSGGQKQRIVIASALASRRELIVFDEPTSGLDRRHMGYVAHNLQELQRLGKTILVITHDPELIMACCTYTLCIEDGKAVAAFPLNNEGRRKTLSFFIEER